ncbi:MAG: hypothetical protein JRI56_00265 [Deltaproteobacteria bacterium]|nr:hypothetical protein [Deltaproteobacteria bacterium]
MKTYKLDLSDYEVVSEVVEIKDGEPVKNLKVEAVSVKKELSELLRLPGIYSDGMELFDGAMLSRQIKECEGDELEINEDELNLLKKVMNKLIGREHAPEKGKIALGGPRYETMIVRVFGL